MSGIRHMARTQTETENETHAVGDSAARERDTSASSQVRGGGGCEIRTREGLPPTRFPTMLAGVHRGPGPSVTWAGRNGWALADAHEPRRMRPHLSPAGPAGPCQRRGPHPCGLPAVPGSRILISGPRGLTGLVGAEPAVIIAGWWAAAALWARLGAAFAGTLLRKAPLSTEVDGDAPR